MIFYRRRFKALDYQTSLALLRTLAYGGSTNRRAMRRLAERVIETAPDDAARRHAQRWESAFQRGHRIKIGIYAAKFYMEGNTPEIEADVESAFADVKDRFTKEIDEA